MTALYLIIAIIALVTWATISFFAIPGTIAIWFYIKKFLIKSKKLEEDANKELERIEKDESDRW